MLFANTKNPNKANKTYSIDLHQPCYISYGQCQQ